MAITGPYEIVHYWFCLSTDTKPTASVGDRLYETNTKLWYVCTDGSTWSALPFDNESAYTVTDPAINAAVTTAILDAYGTVIITLTGAGNAQTIQSPTITTAGKAFTVVNNDTSINTIAVNGITIPVGKAQTWIWDGTAWIEIDLGITSLPVPINQGGTGQVTAATAFDALKQAATDIYAGTIELATNTETVTGSATDRATTPANITAKMSAPGAFGNTTPATSVATTLLHADNLTLDQNVEILAGNKTLVITDMVVQKLDPDGTDRNVLLPTEATSTDLTFIIYNTGGEVGEDLYIQDDAGAALTTVGYKQMAIASCDGTTWTVICVACSGTIAVLSQRVKEENTSAIAVGQPVYVSGATGVAFPTVGLADCDVSTKIRVKGLASETISQNTTGYIRIKGLLEGVNSTKGGVVNPNSEDWTAGDQLWVARTAGGITNVRPTSGRCIKVGTALTVEGANSKILVDIRENEVYSTAASGEDIVLRAGDDVGVNKVSIRNYSNTEVASIDTYGRTLAKFKSIIKASTGNLTAAEMQGCVLNNYGQVADATITLDPAAAGLAFDYIFGTAVAKYFRLDPNGSDSIYVNGATAGDGKYIGIASTQIGDGISFKAIQTGANEWNWVCTYQGAWVSE